MVFKIELAQNSFKDGALLVSNEASDVACYKYDIRVVANDFNNIGLDAIATNTVINDFTITSTPSSFAIPINTTPGAMSDGTRYKVTIRLYIKSDSSIYSYTTPATQLFYYDTRVYTIAPVSVSSPPSVGALSRFDITNVVLRRGSNLANQVALANNDLFFNDVGVSYIFISCTALLNVKDVSNNTFKFNTGTEYFLGSKLFDKTNSVSTSYNLDITTEMNQVGTASAYELWGYLTLSPQFTFGINIVADDTTIGYVINNPEISVELKDVIGLISDNPISITLNNWSHYNTYRFDTLTLEIYDASSNLLLKDASDNPLVYTKPFNNQVVNFSSSDLNSAMNETPLMNGVTYKFKTSLNFTTPSLYKPNLVRSATHVGQFSDLILPIVSGSAVNSWQKDLTKGNGLVVSFQKTDQFYGTLNRLYNLEGNTTVTAEYRTFDTPTSQWAAGWTALSGGSISQPTSPSAVNYELDATNTDGVYSVPVYNVDEKRGNAQDNVYIYAIIPGKQVDYSAVQIRLRLTTTCAVFSSKTSPDYAVPRVTGTTYKNNQVVDDTVTFRYHPKPVAHDFTADKPICTSAGANISFNVPLTVYPFFTAIVTTSDGVCNGSVANMTNPNTYDASNNLWNLSVARTGTGLSYAPGANDTFKLSVKYVSSENSNIYIDTLPMTVKRKGFPSNSFGITSCRWDSVNQEVDYVLSIYATSAITYRMDGWNVYTSAPDASGNLIKDASGNEVSLQQIKLNSDGVTQSVTARGVNYLDYKNITVTFVATRSLYLSENEFSNQVETIGAGVRDTKQTPVTKLPSVLPLINSSDITLENMVYNGITGGSQIAKLSANFPSNAVGLQITDKSVTIPDSIIDNLLVRTIALTNSVVERKYEIKAKYYSVDTPTVQYVYSLPVTVTFKTSTSNRTVPILVSKSYSNKFTVNYTNDNSGSWGSSNTVLVSNVYVKKTGLNGSDTLVGSNDGSVDISVFNGDNVDMYVQDEFTTTYTVDNLSQLSVVQLVKSPSVAFVLAANPQIDESSIVVDGSNNVIKFNVRNMGAPVLHNAMLVASQDSTIDENDQGYYALAYFDNSTTGFLSSSVETNKLTISGANASQTLSITETGTGMNKITTLTFSPIALANANPVNLVLLVRNKTEGSDSCAVANKAISP